MKLKGYILLLLASFTLLGVIESRNLDPNQEIVIQFDGQSHNSLDVGLSISNITERLAEVGAHNLQVHETGNGLYRISYHASSNTKSIKQLLSIDNLIVETGTSKDKNEEYSFDIFELNAKTSSGWDFDGQLVNQITYKSDRYSNPDYYKYFADFAKKETYSVSEICNLNDQNKNAIQAFHSLYHTLEVRAGPIS